MAIVFPTNPTNGLIFEASEGLFYTFSAKENTWIRIDGLESLQPATLSMDGLMLADDLAKLNGLLVPPPRTTLTAEGCDFTFDSGIIGFRSSEDHVNIDHELKLVVKEDGTVISQNVPWQIHENTFGYNFTLNFEELVNELKSRGNINFLGSVGEQGEKGEDGEDGEDRLDTGPVGEDGEDGANVPFTGILSNDPSGTFDFIGDDNRAVVDIRTERISKDENFLILTRANIGNPDACPELLKPISFESTWVLALDTNLARSKVIKEQVSEDCQITCAICSNLFYIDMQTLLDQIFERFVELVLELKAAKESLANSWLTTLVNVFSQTRDAVCCALENCQSRKKNQNERRYIETSRSANAAADFQTIIDGIEEREIIDLQGDRADCIVPGGEAISGTPCQECKLEITVDGRLNSPTKNNAVVTTLEAGDYIAEIEDCCISQFVNTGFTGTIRLAYQLNGVETEIIFPNLGNFPNNEEARNAYVGLRVAFSHSGGSIGAWFPDTFPDDNSGAVTLCVQPSDCFDLPLSGTDVTVIPTVESCEMEASQVCWYERGWRTGACCGVYVSTNGSRFLIVKRSIGTDLTCGGGESLNTECIAQFIASGDGHPAIAFPSIDGDEFLGKPASGTQIFETDDALSDAILAKIAVGDVLDSKGNPAEEIPFILFPVFA